MTTIRGVLDLLGIDYWVIKIHTFKRGGKEKLQHLWASFMLKQSPKRKLNITFHRPSVIRVIKGAFLTTFLFFSMWYMPALWIIINYSILIYLYNQEPIKRIYWIHGLLIANTICMIMELMG